MDGMRWIIRNFGVKDALGSIDVGLVDTQRPFSIGANVG